jgi:hypothetical protein
MTMRVFPPASGLRPAIKVNGRDYTCALGSYLDVPDQDAAVMLSNGWTGATSGAGPGGLGGKTGTTAQRPSAVGIRGADYFDTTLGLVIRSDGMIWRNPATGAAA